MDVPYFQGIGVIKKAVLNFSIKLRWLLVCYYLCSTTVDRLFALDGATLIGSMEDGFDIEFSVIIDIRLMSRHLER